VATVSYDCDIVNIAELGSTLTYQWTRSQIKAKENPIPALGALPLLGRR